jgi:4-amino-4-deoxy-L-arabinose transferase-like glycosyltransferase
MKLRSILVPVMLILLAAATRLYHIQSQSIWFDEGWSAYAAAQPTLLAAVQADATNPPLYYLLLNISIRAFGDNVFGLRWFSLIFGLLTIPLTYQLARRLFNIRAGYYGAFIVVVSPLLWWASQEARMYTLLATLVLVIALAWHQLLRQSSRSSWIVLFIAELLLLYAHNTGPVIVLWINTVTLLAWMTWCSLRRPDWRVWIIGQIAVAILWLPYFLSRFIALQEANSAVTSRPEIGLTLAIQIWQAFWAGSWAMVDHEPFLIGFAALTFILWLLLTPWRKPAACWLVIHAVLLTGGLILGLTLLGNELHGRYLVMVAPLLLIPLGAGISRLPLKIMRYSISAIVIAGLIVMIALAQKPAYQHDDARGMVQYYADHLTAADSVLAWSYADRYDLWYYWNRLGVQARRITLPEGADLDAILPLLPESGDVALNVWYTQRADFRGMMGCLLGNGTVNLPLQHTVYGMSNLLFQSPTLNLPSLNPFEGVVLVNNTPAATINMIGHFPDETADRALCLPIQMTLNQTVNADLKAAVIVRNRFGWEIARADAPFATANQRTTSQLQAGEITMAYPLLRLPYGAPSENYEVVLRVYDEERAPSGYDLTSPQSVFAGKDLALGVWQVSGGADWAVVNRENDLPIQANIPISDHLTLLAHDAEDTKTINNGGSIPLMLLWQGKDPLPDLMLAGAGWEVAIPAEIKTHDSITLDWRIAQVPLDAEAGEAELRLPDGAVISRYTVEVLPALFDKPESGVAVGVEIPGVGTLVGYTVEGNSFSIDQPLPVTLIWRASATPDVSYTVFAQLLDAQGKLIAQSDSIPAQNSRPTTGWRVGEYIIDTHELKFSETVAPGPAALIVGMYDALTGKRLPVTPDGQDFIRLPGIINIR